MKTIMASHLVEAIRAAMAEFGDLPIAMSLSSTDPGHHNLFDVSGVAVAVHRAGKKQSYMGILSEQGISELEPSTTQVQIMDEEPTTKH